LQKEKNNTRRRDNGNGNSNGGYDGYSQGQQAPAANYGAVAAAQPPAAVAAPANGAAADPYAVYGGYQAYLAMWYASFAQQQGGQVPQGPPPGA
jgi:far upstream element-binding protein